MTRSLATLSCFSLLIACGEQPTADSAMPESAPAATSTYIMDTHSHARPQEAVITHLDLDVVVNMEAQHISGTASYQLKRSAGDQVVLDADGIEILGVTAGDRKAEYVLGKVNKDMGQSLTVQLESGEDRITINYQTGVGAKALQWLNPEQTAGKKHPYLFTQGQAILTRTWVPIQDSPGIRITYNAKVKVPAGLMAVMSAENPQKRSADGNYSFKMEQPVPPYLMALAVGDIDFKELGPRTGVYAEPSVLDKAAFEFADTEKMIDAAEGLYGPYRWERYDMIVLPPSFPFGGMENPRLTFATPTILAGDRSLNALIAHELAHSWSGNLVTNATWDDFWLNEGFTVYFEKRISEEVYGKDYAQMLDLLGYQDLQHTVARLEGEGKTADSHLKLSLEGRNPDDGMTDIAYEKGYAFLRVIEETVGREKFDAFLKNYFDQFAFQTMTTERFVTHLNDELLTPNNAEVNVDAWVYGAGLPDNFVKPHSDKFEKVEAQIAAWEAATPASELATEGWTTFEWMHFLRHLPEGMNDAQMSGLDGAFAFSASGNSEILAAWLEQGIKNDYAPIYVTAEEFLTTVGRRKFLVPLYEALAATPEGKERAMRIYAEARKNYHSVSTGTIDEMLDWKIPA